jgi:hypothetical protein
MLKFVSQSPFWVFPLNVSRSMAHYQSQSQNPTQHSQSVIGMAQQRFKGVIRQGLAMNNGKVIIIEKLFFRMS